MALITQRAAYMLDNIFWLSPTLSACLLALSHSDGHVRTCLAALSGLIALCCAALAVHTAIQR